MSIGNFFQSINNFCCLPGLGARNNPHAQESNSRSAREADPAVLATDTSGAALNLCMTNVSNADSLKGELEGHKFTYIDSRTCDSSTVTDAQGTDILFADHMENLGSEEEPTLLSVEATAAHNPRNSREDSSKSVSATRSPADWLAASVYVPRGTLVSSNAAVSTSFSPYNFPVHPEASNWEASSSTTDGNVGLVTSNTLAASVPSSSLPRVHLPTPPQSSSMGINGQLTRFVQGPVSHHQYHGHNSVMVSASGQEMMNTSSFYPDNRGIGNSLWPPPGSGHLQVNDQVTWFDRKNWVSSTDYVSLPPADDSSLGLTEVSSLPVSKTFTTSNQNHLSDTRGLAPSLNFTSSFPASTTADLARGKNISSTFTSLLA